MNSKLKHVHNWPELARQTSWSASRLAQRCGVSVRTLHRHFLDMMGNSTKIWLAEQRQRDAHGLIRNGSSVKEAATRLGYKQQSSLTRKYKRYFGICPSQQLPAITHPSQQLSANDK